MACKFIFQLKTYTIALKDLNVCHRALLVHICRYKLPKCYIPEVNKVYFIAFYIHRIAVYDLGGGTFDISILEIQKGVFEVRYCVLLVHVFLNKW